MPRPRPTPVLHFTRVEHLASIIDAGLECDSRAQEGGLLSIEVGNRGIKADRRIRAVPVHPGGVVADYVPFYFAPRSPMLYSIHMGNVPGYDEGTGRLVYLASTVERLVDAGLDVVVTDRNAVLRLADFHPLADGEPPEDFIDWPLMRQRLWYSTAEYPDRRERRMAECLVHRTVPWETITQVVAKSESVADEVRALADGNPRPEVAVRREWYF